MLLSPTESPLKKVNLPPGYRLHVVNDAETAETGHPLLNSTT
jgi:predicted DNA-binding antitoxin AbrB/MazE fold protein